MRVNKSEVIWLQENLRNSIIIKMEPSVGCIAHVASAWDLAASVCYMEALAVWMFVQQVVSVIPCDVSYLSEHPAGVSTDFIVLSQWAPSLCVCWVYRLASGNLYPLIPQSLWEPSQQLSCRSLCGPGIPFSHKTPGDATQGWDASPGVLSFLSRHWKWKTQTQKHFQHGDPLDETDGQSVAYKVKGFHRPFYITALNNAWHIGAGYVYKELTNRILQAKDIGKCARSIWFWSF